MLNKKLGIILNSLLIFISSLAQAQDKINSAELDAENAKLMKIEAQLLEELSSGKSSESDFVNKTTPPIQQIEEPAVNAATSLKVEEPKAMISVEQDKAEKARGQALAVENESLRKQVSQAELREAQLKRELEQIKNRLLVADTEVERLSSIVEQKNRGKVFSTANTTKNPIQTENVPAAVDVMVATVIADKAHLRTGPSKDDSPLMTVSKGTRLSIENRRGDWYMVIAPTGVRAWVASEVLAFGPTEQSRPTDTVKVRGYDSSAEDQAFQLLSERAK